MKSDEELRAIEEATGFNTASNFSDDKADFPCDVCKKRTAILGTIGMFAAACCLECGTVWYPARLSVIDLDSQNWNVPERVKNQELTMTLLPKVWTAWSIHGMDLEFFVEGDSNVSLHVRRKSPT